MLANGNLLCSLVMSCFSDSSSILQPCVSVFTFEEAISSSRLYGLSLVRKDHHLVGGGGGYAGVHCGSRSSGHVWGHVTSLGPGEGVWCIISSVAWDP